MRKINYYQIIALVIAVGLALTFLYIYALSPPTSHVIFDNMTVTVGAHDYEALKFEVPSEFGSESVEARFEVMGNAQSGADILNVYVVDLPARFECIKQLNSTETIGSDRDRCLGMPVDTFYEETSAPSGSIDRRMQKGTYYLVLDNLEFPDSKSVRVNLSIVVRL